MKWVWKCRDCGREYPEDAKTGSGDNDLSVYRNPSGIVGRACHNCGGVVDLCPTLHAPDAAKSAAEIE